MATGRHTVRGVSDLQCAATLLVSRHGDAQYARPGHLSDDGGWLSDLGREQVTALATSLLGQRVAAVWSSTMRRAVESAELAADLLGVPVRTLEGLQEFSVGDLAGLSFHDSRAQAVFDRWLAGDLDAGCPGGEDGHTLLARYRDAVETIADLHRGERVLVFSHGGVMSLVIPRLSINRRADLAAQRFLPNCVPAELAVDADGWVVRSWPGSTDPDVV